MTVAASFKGSEVSFSNSPTEGEWRPIIELMKLDDEECEVFSLSAFFDRGVIVWPGCGHIQPFFTR